MFNLPVWRLRELFFVFHVFRMLCFLLGREIIVHLFVGHLLIKRLFFDYPRTVFKNSTGGVQCDVNTHFEMRFPSIIILGKTFVSRIGATLREHRKVAYK